MKVPIAQTVRAVPQEDMLHNRDNKHPSVAWGQNERHNMWSSGLINARFFLIDNGIYMANYKGS